MPSLIVAGAGMAGLVAGVRARELGLRPEVHEAGSRPGGSLSLSSGVIWRHRTAAAFRAECPQGDEALQLTILERLDEALAWLRSLGAFVTGEHTGNPRTVGKRFDARSVVDSLARRIALRLSSRLDSLDGPTVLACGGYAAALARERGLFLRAAPWSDGQGIRLGLAAGAARRGNEGQFYARALPAPPARVGPGDFVRAAQLYGRLAHVVDLESRPLGGGWAWHEVDLAQAVAARPRGEAWYVVDSAGLREQVRGRLVGEMVAVADELGGEVRRARSRVRLGLGDLESPLLGKGPFTAVRVKAGVTHTYAGLAVDPDARVLDAAGLPLERLWACGADAGGIFDGGYASGLAAALVLGLAAAEDAARNAG
jgi:fumarate reductase flavoprotein subunit